MAPDPGAKAKLRTVGVPFARLVPDAAHAKAIGDAVHSVNGATRLATELLNLHVRERLENHGGEGLNDVFDANWLLNAYNEVTFARGKPKVVDELRATRDAHMPAFLFTRARRSSNAAPLDRDASGRKRVWHRHPCLQRLKRSHRTVSISCPRLV